MSSPQVPADPRLAPPPADPHNADSQDSPAAPPPGGVRARTQLQAVEQWEVANARKTRGNCRDCGHSWRPRNPSTAVNRCPGCGHRGTVTYVHHDAETPI